MLPPGYNFEISKCRKKITELDARRVCLQLPEGLMVWSEAIAYELEQGTNADIIIIGDVTYGACCVDDHKAMAMGCDLLIHYGHSCLVPIDSVGLPCLYVFVEIQLNAQHLAQYVDSIFGKKQALSDFKNPDEDDDASTEASPTSASGFKKTVIALMGVIQYSNSLHLTRSLLDELWKGRQDVEVVIPQCLPLTSGETLGCTSPTLPEQVTDVVFIADGRFHLEALMIQNPDFKNFLRYDPFLKKMFHETYDHDGLRECRQRAIGRAREDTTHVCVIMSTLGRQGSVGLFECLTKRFEELRFPVMKIFIAELKETTLKLIASGVQGTVTFVNVGCPRLPMDWGNEFMEEHPFLSTYEAFQAFFVPKPEMRHQMDFFSTSGGEWSNYYADRPRNGSIATQTESKKRATLLRERWLARKAQMQNV